MGSASVKEKWRQPKSAERSCENNINLLFLACENIIFFHLRKYPFYLFILDIHWFLGLQ